MQQQSNHSTAVLESTPPPAVKTVTGTVQRVDLVQREMKVIVGTQPFDVDVPPQCPVILRGERIKLRMIQPSDVVQIRFARRATVLIAKRVEVVPVNSLPATGKT